MDEYSIGHFLSGCSRFRGRGCSGNLDDFELKPEDMKKLP